MCVWSKDLFGQNHNNIEENENLYFKLWLCAVCKKSLYSVGACI